MTDADLRVAVIDDWQAVARLSADWSLLERRAQLQFFQEPFADEASAAAALAPFQIIVPMRERLQFPRSLLERLPRLRLLALTGYGTRHVDMACCAQRHIVCCASGGAYSPAATAELTLGLMLAAQRHLARADATMRAGGWQRGIPLGRTLEGQTLGLIGLGRIGGRVASYARSLGMQLLAWSTNLTAAQAQAAGATAVGKSELLQRADIVTLHLMLSQRSLATLGAAELALMKPGALLVNTARGPLVEEQALLAALRDGRIRAALDVYAQEPLPADHPLRSMPDTVLIAHQGFSTERTMAEFYGQSIENILAFLDGRALRVVSA
jgi:phosphoglycerate dehydrogenase-like enzyme